MKRVNKPYKVTTENETAFFKTLAEAIIDYSKWIAFYEVAKTRGINYGERNISISKNGESIVIYHVYETI